MAVCSASATPYVWTGSVDNDWSRAANWQDNQAPPTSGLDSSAILYNDSNARKPSLPATYSVQGLNFNSVDQSYTFESGALILGANGIAQYRSVVETFDIPVSLGAGSTWNLSGRPGTLNFNKGLALGNNALILNVALMFSGGSFFGEAILGGPITGSGGLTKNGTGTLTLTGANTYIGDVFMSAGVVAVGNGGSINGPANIGIVNSLLTISGTGSVTAARGSNTITVDGPGISVLGGTLNLSGTSIGTYASGTLSQGGGSVTGDSTYPIVLGYRGNTSGLLSLSGGTFTAPLRVVLGSNGNGTVQQGGGRLTTAELFFASAPATTGTYHLSGGTLNVASITHGTGQSVFNFNGGTLQAPANNPTFLQGLTTANVRGGAVIDTNGYKVTVAQPLLHSTLADDPTVDGGLTKVGQGTLTLTGANTYNGGTTIKAGTVIVAGDSDADTNPLGNSHGPVTLLGGSLAFTDNAVMTRRTFNLGTGTLGPASGGSLSYQFAAVNGGTLGAGNHFVTAASTFDGVRATTGTVFSVSQAAAAFNNVLFTGNSLLNVNDGAGIEATGDFVLTPLTTLTVGGRARAAGGSISGAVTITGTGRLIGSGAAPLYLDGSRGVTVNAGGQLNAEGGSTIELGGLLINHGVQTGVLHVNLGGIVQGGGSFGSVSLAANGTFNATGAITGNLFVASGATVNLSGSGRTLVVNGAVTNNGVMRFDHGASLSVTSGAANLVNNGTIDLITGSASLPAGFVNNGLVLDSSVTKVKSVARAADGASVTLQIDAYPGHTYKLQRSNGPASGSFADVQGVPAQGNAATNTAPVTLTFTDPAPVAVQGFYRVQVDS